MASQATRRGALKTHVDKKCDPTGTKGAIRQPDSRSDFLESGMQAGRSTLVPDVRSHFVPVGQRYKMEAAHHTTASNQQVLQREERRAAQQHGVERLVEKDVFNRTHHHDGSLVTKHPTVFQLLKRFPAEAHDEMVLRDENIGQMPIHMEILRHIRKVDLSNNKLHRLSEGITEVLKLEELVLACNELVELPKNTQLLTNLKILDARSNHITFLPEMLGLKSLRYLNVSDNDLEVINDSVQKLSQLTCIDVRYCQLKEFHQPVHAFRDEHIVLRLQMELQKV